MSSVTVGSIRGRDAAPAAQTMGPTIRAPRGRLFMLALFS
jgi:hypothetical protein